MLYLRYNSQLLTALPFSSFFLFNHSFIFSAVWLILPCQAEASTTDNCIKNLIFASFTAFLSIVTGSPTLCFSYEVSPLFHYNLQWLNLYHNPLPSTTYTLDFCLYLIACTISIKTNSLDFLFPHFRSSTSNPVPFFLSPNLFINSDISILKQKKLTSRLFYSSKYFLISLIKIPLSDFLFVSSYG